MRAFFDTNILIYAHQAGHKSIVSRDLFEQDGFVSVQVLNEFVSVARDKYGMDWNAIEIALENILNLVKKPVPLTIETHLAAVAISRDHRMSIYDALIVAAASQAGCDVLYTEDMRDGRVFGGLTIRDPFRAEA
jgi:predicted nucleic acid-binding protein